jgi:hypothetical protein
MAFLDKQRVWDIELFFSFVFFSIYIVFRERKKGGSV